MIFTQDKLYTVPGENAWKLSRQTSDVYDKKRWKEEEEEYVITQFELALRARSCEDAACLEVEPLFTKF